MHDGLYRVQKDNYDKLSLKTYEIDQKIENALDENTKCEKLYQEILNSFIDKLVIEEKENVINEYFENVNVEDGNIDLAEHASSAFQNFSFNNSIEFIKIKCKFNIDILNNKIQAVLDSLKQDIEKLVEEANINTDLETKGMIFSTTSAPLQDKIIAAVSQGLPSEEILISFSRNEAAQLNNKPKP